MDQLPQGASTPLPQQPSSQIPQVTSQQPLPQAAPTQPAPVQPTPAQPVNVAPASPSKLKNPKLWIGVGIGILIIVVVSALFIGKPSLFMGQVRDRATGDRGAANACDRLNEMLCGRAAERRICEWVVPAGGRGARCMAVERTPPPAEVTPAEVTPAPAANIERTRTVALAEADRLIAEANAAASEAGIQAQAANTNEVRDAARESQTAARAAEAAIATIRNARTDEEIQRARATILSLHGDALRQRDIATALANEAAAALTPEDAATEVVTRETAETTAVASGVASGVVIESDIGRPATPEPTTRLTFQQFCESQKLTWNNTNATCSLEGRPFNNLTDLQTAIETVTQERQRLECIAQENFEWNGSECVREEISPLVAVTQVLRCPSNTPVNFKGECFEQNALCNTLSADLANSLQDGRTKSGDLAGAVAELNNLSGCSFQAATFLAAHEEEKARDECKAKDQNVWGWNQGAKVCKNKQEERITDLENLVGSLQGQLVVAQNANNNAQINALNTQIANLIAEMNNVRQAAGQPIVVNVVAPPAPAPSSGGGGAEIVAIDIKETKKKKEKKTTSTATAESAAASTPAVSDSGAAAGVVAVQPAVAGTAAAGAAAGSASSASAASAAAATRVTHGAFIQGRTGPGVLFYPVIVAVANGMYYWLRKRKRN